MFQLFLDNELGIVTDWLAIMQTGDINAEVNSVFQCPSNKENYFFQFLNSQEHSIPFDGERIILHNCIMSSVIKIYESLVGEQIVLDS